MTFEEWWDKRWVEVPNKHYAMITAKVAYEAWQAADRNAREECAAICENEELAEECVEEIRATIKAKIEEAERRGKA